MALVTYSFGHLAYGIVIGYNLCITTGYVTRSDSPEEAHQDSGAIPANRIRRLQYVFH